MIYGRNRRISTAKHEAGHALVLLALGLPFKNIEIVPGKITLNTPKFR